MDTSVNDVSITSRKCKRNEEEMAELEETTFIVLSVVTMFLGVMSLHLKSHEEAKRFRFKVIPNWDDIVDICAKDKANGVGAKSAVDADDVMSKEANEEEEDSNVNIGLEEPSFATKKKGLTRANKSRDKEGIITSMREVAESLKEFVQVTKKKMEGNAQEVVQEVLNELKMILDLDNALWYKAIVWLTENPNKLVILKALPLGEKKDFVLAFMA